MTPTTTRRKSGHAVAHDDPWLSFEEVCRDFGIEEGELRYLRANGGGPPFIKVGRKLRIRRSEARGWFRGTQYVAAYLPDKRTGPRRPTVTAVAADSDSDSDSDPWLYFNDVAEELEIKPRTLRHLRATGEGPPFIQIGRELRIRRSAARKWFADKYESADQ